MEPSSRTPEGEPNACPVCGKRVQIDPSRPPGDAPCPHCGHLLWFGDREGHQDETIPVGQQQGFSDLPPQTQAVFDRNEMAVQESRLRRGEFTLDDFRKMLCQTQKLGPIRRVLGMTPGMGDLFGSGPDEDLQRVVAIIDAMTSEERAHPELIGKDRRRQIAQAAGVHPHEVREMITQFAGMASTMQRMAKMRH